MLVIGDFTDPYERLPAFAAELGRKAVIVLRTPRRSHLLFQDSLLLLCAGRGPVQRDQSGGQRSAPHHLLHRQQEDFRRSAPLQSFGNQGRYNQCTLHVRSMSCRVNETNK